MTPVLKGCKVEAALPGATLASKQLSSKDVWEVKEAGAQ